MHQRKADVVHVRQHKHFLKKEQRRVKSAGESDHNEKTCGTEERKDEAESHWDRRRQDNQEMDGVMEVKGHAEGL